MSLSLEIHGIVRKVGDTVQVTDKFRKREVVVHIADQQNPQYDDFLSVQFNQDRCDKLNAVNVGDEIKIQTNVRGKEYTDKTTGELKYFNTIEGWKVEVVSATVTQAQTPPLPMEPPAPAQPEPTVTNEDLPF